VELAHFEAHLRKAGDGVSDVEPSRIGETAELNAVRTAFKGTIATGGVASPLGSMLEKIMRKTCPAGFGGSFTDDGNTVELWYVDLD